MNAGMLSELKESGEKIATELVFAEPGTDLGLLPVNSLLGQIEEQLAAESWPENLVLAAQRARGWINQIFETSGTFDKATIARFSEWVSWWQEATGACAANRAVPPLPQGWEKKVETTGLGASSAGVTKSALPSASEALDEPVLFLNLEKDGQLLAEFINESQEHLQNIEQGVLTLENDPTDADTLNSIFRAFHTFKGGSGFLNLLAIQNLAHQLESLLDQARQRKLVITPEIINLILLGGDTLKQYVAEIGLQLAGKKAPGAIVVPTLKLLASIRAILEGAPSELAQAQPPKGEENIPDISGTTVQIPSESPPQSAPESREPARANASGSVDKLGVVRTNALGVAVKVDTQKLDGLVDLVGEMVIAQSLVGQNRELTQLQNEQLNRDLARLSRITKDLQRIVMSLRMVPIRGTFHKMQRLVRDLAAKVGKRVELVTEGEDTELDRTIVEEISDPLIHMIRNSVDHGIEKPDARRQCGKPETGTVSLRAFHQGGSIIIQIKDDGRGLDRERIIAKGIEKGLIRPGEQLTDTQVFNLILSAGFSTAEKVTDLSGRGVGMDVVRRNIEKLRGKLEIQSRFGEGSTFSIYLPLTLAIIDGLLVGVGEQRYIVPTLLVRESFRPKAEMIHTVHGRGEMINVRGHLLPVLRLYKHLGIMPNSEEPSESIAVVVEAGTDARCVLVDKLLGKQEVVIKSLGETFSRNRSVAGAAILGDGHVGLILDPHALVHPESLDLQAAA